MKHKLPKATYIENEDKEKRELNTLGLLLSSRLRNALTPGDDKVPNIDGYLEILDGERAITGQKIDVQVKPLRFRKNGQPYSTCDIKLLGYAQEANVPLLLIGVDANKNVAYWQYLGKEFIDDLLKGRETLPQSIDIPFHAQNKIEKGKDDYVDKWKDICNYHLNKENDALITGLIEEERDPLYYGVEALDEKLKILKSLVFYRSFDGERPILNFALDKYPSLLRRTSQKKDRIADFVLKRAQESYLDLLHMARYLATRRIFSIYASAFKEVENASLKSHLTKKIEEISGYNYHALIQLGFHPQDEILKEVLSWTVEERISNLPVIKIAFEKMLSPSFEGTSMKDEITMVFHRGGLVPNEFLIKSRNKIIDTLFELLDTLKDVKDKIVILNVLDHASYAPHEDMAPEQKEKADKMIEDNVTKIVKEYKKKFFNKKGAFSHPSALIGLKLERQLKMLHRMHGKRIPSIKDLFEALQDDKGFYGFYRLMGAEFWMLSEDVDYQGRQNTWEVKTDDILKEIKANGDEVALIDNMVKVAQEGTVDGLNSFMNFRNFLLKLGKKNPALAKRAIMFALEKGNALCEHLPDLIAGIRNAGDIVTIDELYVFAKKNKDKRLAISLAMSFFNIDMDKSTVQSEDEIKRVKSIVIGINEFAFVKDLKLSPQEFFNLFRGVLNIYKSNPALCKEIVLWLIKEYPLSRNGQISQLEWALSQKLMTLDGWTPEDVEVIKQLLIKAPNISYHEERLLCELGEHDFSVVTEVIYKRVTEEKKKHSILSHREEDSYYNAVPRHADELKELIEKNKEKFEKLINDWIDKCSDKDLVLRFSINQIIEHLAPGSSRKEIFLRLATSGKKGNLIKATRLFPDFQSISAEIWTQIIDKTDDQEIWDDVRGYLMNPGSYGGAYGDNILGHALQERLNVLKEVEKTATSARVKLFISETIPRLEVAIKQSEIDHEKEMKKRSKK